MTSSGHNPHLFRWRSKTPANKVHVKYGDIDQWRKHVERASECAVSEVFSQKKPRSGSHSLSMPLHTQALLGDWLGSKLRLELELEEEDDLACPAGRRSPDALAGAQPAVLKYNNFEDLYNCLAEEEEQGAVSSFLQDLMEQELLDSGVIEDLALDVGQTRKKFRNPIVTMEARHLQVRENRTRREAEKQRLQREREAQRVAREEAQRGARGEEMRRKQEARRQEEMVQQEMVRLRRQREERRGLEQMVRQREKERGEGQRAARGLQPTPPLPTKQQLQDTEQRYRQEKTQTKVHMHDLQRLQRHFSGWYSVVLDRRLRLGKAMALCDWKRQLRAWRAWWAVVWAQRRQREVVKTEEELRAENRQRQLAAESDRKRLLRRCLSEWQLWCRMEKEQRELLSQQQETRRKMAALINAASAGKLEATETSKHQQIMAPPEVVSTHLEKTNKEDHEGSGPLAPNTSTAQQKTTPVGAMTRPTQPWQVTRRHAAPTAAEVHGAQRKGGSDDVPGSNIRASSRYGKRHTVQQQIITQQRKLLREQQEQIARLKEEQSVVSLELEMEKTAQITQLSVLRGQRAKGYKADPAEHRAHTAPAVPEGLCAPQREAASQQKFPHPIIAAMEDRARQRAERRKEVEELKQRKEEKKLAELKAAEEQRKREQEEEKHRAAERKREEKRQEKERKEEKQRQLKRHQELLELARQHHHRNLLLRRGLAPWKRLIQLRQANIQLADGHHNLLLLRRCTRGWLQSARESLSEREASADRLYQHALLQRGLSCWKRLKDWRFIQEQRAERFYRARTLRRFLLALLDHVTQERLMEWDRQELSQEHNNRRLLWRCFLTWRQLPSLLRKEREKEVRRERLGRRVAEVLPDFCSNPL